MSIFGKWFKSAETKRNQNNKAMAELSSALRSGLSPHMSRALEQMEEDEAAQENAEILARSAAKRLTGSKRPVIEPVAAIDRGQSAFDQTCRALYPTNFGDVEAIIKRIGFDKAIEFYAHLVRLRLRTHHARLQFILEELDAARQGNSAAQAFARQSGIKEAEYIDALDRSFDEVDGPEGPQQTLLTLCMQLRQNMDLVVKFRTSIVRLIMKDHGFSV